MVEMMGPTYVLRHTQSIHHGRLIGSVAAPAITQAQEFAAALNGCRPEQPVQLTVAAAVTGPVHNNQPGPSRLQQ